MKEPVFPLIKPASSQLMSVCDVHYPATPDSPEVVQEPGLGVVRLAVLQSPGHRGEGGRDWAGGREESEAGDQAGGRKTRQTARLCYRLLSYTRVGALGHGCIIF